MKVVSNTIEYNNHYPINLKIRNMCNKNSDPKNSENPKYRVFENSKKPTFNSSKDLYQNLKSQECHNLIVTQDNKALAALTSSKHGPTILINDLYKYNGKNGKQFIQLFPEKKPIPPNFVYNPKYNPYMEQADILHANFIQISVSKKKKNY